VTAVVAASEQATTRLESLASVVAQMQSPSCDFGITASHGAFSQDLRYAHAVLRIVLISLDGFTSFYWTDPRARMPTLR
jgi:hypothetical protein